MQIPVKTNESKPTGTAAGPAGDDAKFEDVPVQGEDEEEPDEPYPVLDEEGVIGMSKIIQVQFEF